MPVEREASCGSEERSDAWVRVQPGTGTHIRVRSKSGPMYEDRIVEVATEVVHRLGVTDVEAEVNEEGAYDHVIAARVEGAVFRATGGGEAFHQPLAIWEQRETTARDRLRRTRLYVPGNNARTLAFVDAFRPDCLLFDLEDAVAPAQKDAARFLVRRTLATMGFGNTELWVRINPLERGGREDLRVVLGGRPHGICLPKAESAVQVTELAGILYELEGRYGLPWRTWIMPIVESPKGVLAAMDVAQASERVVCVAFGAEDYTREVRCTRDWETLSWARSHLVAAARAAGVQASDSVLSHVDDEETLCEETQRARALGFDGKGVIHPMQIETVHRALAPTDEELAWAQGVVAAAQEAEARGAGAVSFQGRMIDRPVVLRAQRILEVAKELGLEVAHAG